MLLGQHIPDWCHSTISLGRGFKTDGQSFPKGAAFSKLPPLQEAYSFLRYVNVPHLLRVILWGVGGVSLFPKIWTFYLEKYVHKLSKFCVQLYKSMNPA